MGYKPQPRYLLTTKANAEVFMPASVVAKLPKSNDGLKVVIDIETAFECWLMNQTQLSDCGSILTEAELKTQKDADGTNWKVV